MSKSILNLKGIQKLSRNEQKAVNGGNSCWGAGLICYHDFDSDSDTYNSFVCEVGNGKSICYCCQLIPAG